MHSHVTNTQGCELTFRRRFAPTLTVFVAAMRGPCSSRVYDRMANSSASVMPGTIVTNCAGTYAVVIE